MSKQRKNIGVLMEETLVPQEDQPYEIPANWVWVKSGSILNFVGGGTPSKGNNDYWNGNIPWATVKDIKKEYLSSTIDHITNQGLENTSATLAQPNELLLVTRMSPGKSAITEMPTAINQDLKIVRPKLEIPSYFLKLYFKLKKPMIESMSTGSTVKGIQVKKLKELAFPLPPLAEQKRIVEKVENLFTKIDEAKQLIEEAEKSFELRRLAILDKAFRGELTKKWRSENANISFQITELEDERKRLKEKHFKNKTYKESVKISLGDKTKGITETYEIPETWKWVTIDQVTWNVSDGPHFSPKYVEKDNGIPFISTRNISYQGINFKNCKFVSREDHEEFSKRSNPEVGDVILTKGGTTGIATVVEEDRPFSIWVHLALLKLIKKYVSPHYLRDVMASPFVYAQSQAQTRGVTNKDLGLTRLVYMAMPLPPLKEQNEIVKLIDKLFEKLDTNKALCDKLTSDLDLLKQSILSRAFRGELGTNDPSEESAIELLKEILSVQ